MTGALILPSVRSSGPKLGTLKARLTVPVLYLILRFLEDLAVSGGSD